jgi:hypothetical protein
VRCHRGTQRTSNQNCANTLRARRWTHLLFREELKRDVAVYQRADDLAKREVLRQITLRDPTGRKLVAQFRRASLADIPGIEQLIALSARGLSRTTIRTNRSGLRWEPRWAWIHNCSETAPTSSQRPTKRWWPAVGGAGGRRSSEPMGRPIGSRSRWIQPAMPRGFERSSSTRTGRVGVLVGRRLNCARRRPAGTASHRRSSWPRCRVSVSTGCGYVSRDHPTHPAWRPGYSVCAHAQSLHRLLGGIESVTS